MGSEPGLSTESHSGESSGGPVTAAANSNGGETSQSAFQNPGNGGRMMPAPRANGETGVAPPAYVYAIGQIEPRFPTLSAEKEFAQATGRDGRAFGSPGAARGSLAARKSLSGAAILLGPEDREPGHLHPATARSRRSRSAGGSGPANAAPNRCRCGGRRERTHRPARAVQRAHGSDRGVRSDLLLRRRYPGEIDSATEGDRRQGLRSRRRRAVLSDHAVGRQRRRDGRASRRELSCGPLSGDLCHGCRSFRAEQSLSAVEVRASPLSGTRRIMDVIFSFTNRQTDVIEKFFTRVDVTEEFPFLVTKMSPYCDH